MNFGLNIIILTAGLLMWVDLSDPHQTVIQQNPRADILHDQNQGVDILHDQNTYKEQKIALSCAGAVFKKKR